MSYQYRLSHATEKRRITAVHVDEEETHTDEIINKFRRAEVVIAAGSTVAAGRWPAAP